MTHTATGVRCDRCGRSATTSEAVAHGWLLWSGSLSVARAFGPEDSTDLHPYCPECARIEFGKQPVAAVSRPRSGRQLALHVTALAVAIAAIGAVMLFFYAVANLDLFCHGGVTESYDAAAAIGAVLWLGVVVTAGLLRRQFAWLLVGFAAVYLVALIVLAALSSTIWGPTWCGGVGP